MRKRSIIFCILVGVIFSIFLSFVYGQGGAGPICDNCRLPHRGDADNDCRITITDAVFILNRLFRGGWLFCNQQDYYESADVNGDIRIDITDAVYLLRFLFQGGPAPVGLPVIEDSINLATATQKLYYKSNLNDVRTVITRNEMPTLLEDETLTDKAGIQYPYAQEILVGRSLIEYGNSQGDLGDPKLLIDVGTISPVYTYRLNFINVELGFNQDLVGSNLIAMGKKFTVTGITLNPLSIQLTDEDGGILKFEDGQTIKKGADENVIQGTRALIYFQRGFLTAIDVVIAMQSSVKDHIALGEVFTDPVFGRLKLDFAAANLADTSNDREEIRVETDNNQFAIVTFTPFTVRDLRGGGCYATPDGVVTCTIPINFTWDSDPSSTKVTPVLAYREVGASGRGKIHVVEGEQAMAGDWIVVNQGDKGIILKVDDIIADTATTGTVIFKDVFTHTTKIITLIKQEFSEEYTNSNVLIFGGVYHLMVNRDGTLVNMTWGSGSSPGNVGDVATLFPRIKTSKGGWISFLTEINFSMMGSVKISLPGKEDLATYEAGEWIGNLLTSDFGNIKYITNGDTIIGVKVNGDNNRCFFDVNRGPAILIQEERKQNEAGNNIDGDVICIPLTTIGSKEIAIGDPIISGIRSDYITWSSDSFKKTAVTRYGSALKKIDRTNQNGVAVVHYPDNQMYLDIFFKG